MEMLMGTGESTAMAGGGGGNAVWEPAGCTTAPVLSAQNRAGVTPAPHIPAPSMCHPRLHLSKIHTGIFSPLPSLSLVLPLCFSISAPPPPVTICAGLGLTLKLVPMNV